MSIASVAIDGELMATDLLDEVIEQLGQIGAHAYIVEVAGSGNVEVELNGETFVGQQALADKVDSITSKRV